MATELEKIRDRLLSKLTTETRRLEHYDMYVEGEQPLRFIAAALEDELGERLTKVVLNWPRYAVGAYDDRLDVRGFRYPGAGEADEDLWGIWQENDGELISQQIHEEALSLGRSYAIVGEGEDDEVPLITAESPFDCIHELDPRTHEVAHGIKKWTNLDGDRFVTLYQPGGRMTWWRPARSGRWAEHDVREDGAYVTTEYGLPQIVPFVNQQRSLGRARSRYSKFDQRLGRAEFHDIIPLADAANKMATDMMVSGEYHAMPRRWAFGLKESDFVDANDNPISAWSMVAGRLWANENAEVKVGQFAEADLGNFRETIKLLGQLAGQLLALPPSYLGFQGGNPPSADGIRADEARLVKRAERKQTGFGNRHERVQRLVVAVRGGSTEDAAKAKRIETLWRDAATPTRAQESDAMVKLVTARDGRGRSVVPVEQAREDLGYTDEQQKRMAGYDNAQDPQIAAATRDLRSIGAPAPAGG
jgi:hypothetical protein